MPYRLPLTVPFRWSGGEVASREGVLLRLEDERGRVGWGDGAPLPGFSRETLGEATRTLANAAEIVRDRALDALDLTNPGGDFHTALDAADLAPSARYALDLALWDLAAQALGRTLPHTMHPDPAVLLPVNALLSEEGEALLDEALRRVAEGYRTLKLKVGWGPIEDDAERVRAVRERVGSGVALRADANRGWSWTEAVAFAEGVRGAALDYVEEPLREPARLPELWADTGLPIALDETLAERTGEEAIRGWVRAAILKPTLLGGVAATLRLAARARSVGVRPILSGAFESGVGLRGVAALAAATGAEPAGLDPYRRLATDVLAERLPLDRPVVDVPALFARPVEVALR
ncbi:MAG TPA: o-succinylbenzoate synthase [Rubricoccaceae bacterium]|nr:o-succinylbenzoate synthase [Rubricoccaceae bacterium]